MKQMSIFTCIVPLLVPLAASSPHLKPATLEIAMEKEPRPQDNPQPFLELRSEEQPKILK
jgi:hypothetical protein